MTGRKRGNIMKYTIYMTVNGVEFTTETNDAHKAWKAFKTAMNKGKEATLFQDTKVIASYLEVIGWWGFKDSVTGNWKVNHSSDGDTRFQKLAKLYERITGISIYRSDNHAIWSFIGRNCK